MCSVSTVLMAEAPAGCPVYRSTLGGLTLGELGYYWVYSHSPSPLLLLIVLHTISFEQRYSMTQHWIILKGKRSFLSNTKNKFYRLKM